jgi:hypothetical protein
MRQTDQPWRLPFLNNSEADMLNALNYVPPAQNSDVDMRNALEYVPEMSVQPQSFIPPPPPQPNYLISQLHPSQAVLYNRALEIARVGGMLRNWMAEQNAAKNISAMTMPHVLPQMSARNLLNGPSERWSSNWGGGVQSSQSLPITQPTLQLTNRSQSLPLTYVPNVDVNLDSNLNARTAEPTINNNPTPLPPPIQDLEQAISIPKTIGKAGKRKNLGKERQDKEKKELEIVNEKLAKTAAETDKPKSKQQLWLPLPSARKRSHQKDALDLREKYVPTATKRSARSNFPKKISPQKFEQSVGNALKYVKKLSPKNSIPFSN